MEELLNKLLDKLPDYEGLVFRGEEMSSYRKDFFQEVLANKVSLEEPAFLSTTRSEQIAQMFSRGDTVFRIASFSGKSIEAVAFHGLGSPMNEREVLFKSKTRFRVLADFLKKYPVQTVGSSIHQEYWIPAEELADFNRNIVGKIEIIAEYQP